MYYKNLIFIIRKKLLTREKLQFVNFLSVFFIFEKLLKSKFFTFSLLFLLNMGFRRPILHTFHIVFHIHVKKAGFTDCIIVKIPWLPYQKAHLYFV